MLPWLWRCEISGEPAGGLLCKDGLDERDEVERYERMEGKERERTGISFFRLKKGPAARFFRSWDG